MKAEEARKLMSVHDHEHLTYIYEKIGFVAKSRGNYIYIYQKPPKGIIEQLIEDGYKYEEIYEGIIDPIRNEGFVARISW